MKKVIVINTLLVFSALSFLQAQNNYRVELSVFMEKVPNNYFYGLEDVWVVKDHNDFYRYNYGGDFNTLEEAQEAQKMAQEQGYQFAKVIDLEVAKTACVCDEPVYLSSIFFDFDKANLRAKSIAELNALLGILRKNPEYKAELDGHTDSKGTEPYNVNLSQRRANAAKNYLLKQGIASSRLLTKHFGEQAPIAKNEWKAGIDSPEGRQFNRRVTMQVIDSSGTPVQDMVEKIRVPDNLIVAN